MENLRETYRKPYRTACTFPLHPAGTSLTSCGASYGTQHNSHPSLPLPQGEPSQIPECLHPFI